VVSDGKQERLIILWGLQSDKPEGNLRVEAIVDQLHLHFRGKPRLKPLNPALTIQPATFDHGQTNDPDVASETAATMPVATPTVKHRTLKRSVRIFCTLLLTLVVGSEFCHWYLPPSLSVESFKSDPSVPGSMWLELAPGDVLTQWDGTQLEATDAAMTYAMARVPHAGRFQWHLQQQGSDDAPKVFTIEYDPSRKDMNPAPIASMRVSSLQIPVDSEVAVFAGHSFHPQSSKTLDLQLHWGIDGEPYVKLDPDSPKLDRTYTKPGIYSLSLLATDPDGNWDETGVKVRVFDDSGAQLPALAPPAPCLDVSIASIAAHENRTRVMLDLSQTLDPDGLLRTIEVDWGDGSPSRTFHTGAVLLQHEYKASHQRGYIHLNGYNAPNTHPVSQATLFIDLQSAAAVNFPHTQLPPFSSGDQVRWLKSESPSLRLQLRMEPNLFRGRQRMTLLAFPPESHPHAPLLNLHWIWEAPNDSRIEVKDGLGIRVTASEGAHHLWIRANTPDGNSYETTHTIRVVTKLRINPGEKLMHDWVDHVPSLLQLLR
jgi:hypothetical protein